MAAVGRDRRRGFDNLWWAVEPSSSTGEKRVDRWWFARHRQWTTRRQLTTQPIPLTPSPPELSNIQNFRQQALGPQKPFLFARDTGSSTNLLPAATKWFHQDGINGSTKATPPWTLTPYMIQFQEWPFPYELVAPLPKNQEALIAFRNWLLSSKEPADQILASILEPSIADLGRQTFFQLFAPFRLLIKALEFNHLQHHEHSEPVELYIAQSSLTELPTALQDDLPTPELVRSAGKGDVYSSSIWLGTEPTYTPLHRDPNPNLFCQLCNTKLIRLMPPAPGDRLFFEVQRRIRQQGNSRIRTVEMMEGKEREALHEAIWQPDTLPEQLYEAELGPGDSLFIPNGWWHSVKSKGSQGHLNGSVNWWFR
ncbi:cupin-like domain-containing protein [Ilyonectria destructans]|nr:cupin-like domain-containing protein [Ilyonectria destructans]